MRCTLESGQEAAQVGFVSATRPDDIFGPTHRDLTAQLTKGRHASEEAMLNFYAKATGPSKGRDGNTHLACWRRAH